MSRRCMNGLMHCSKIASLFDHLVGAGEQRRRYVERHSRNGTLWNIDSGSASLRLDAGGLDHFAPLLGFISDKVIEIGRRAGKNRAAQGGDLRLCSGIGKARVDLPVEL